ncbi:MAG: alpha/beta fold hydrolase [Chromatocurvus sp.]
MAEIDSIELNVTSGGDGPDVVLLHGLFGMGVNLGGLGKSLQDAYRVHLVDLPDHGRSGWTRQSDLRSMANALAQWLQTQSIAGVHCVGHSLGGKVAMQFALDHPASAASLVVADIAPVTYSRSHDQVFAALSAVDTADCHSRAEADAVMSGYIDDEGVRQFLLMSLYRSKDGSYHWRFNLEGLQRNYAAYLQAPVVENVYDGRALFIRGGLSNYVKDEYLADIHDVFTGASVETMADCGHWLHAEQPAVFNSLVRNFIAGEAA